MRSKLNGYCPTLYIFKNDVISSGSLGKYDSDGRHAGRGRDARDKAAVVDATLVAGALGLEKGQMPDTMVTHKHPNAHISMARPTEGGVFSLSRRFELLPSSLLVTVPAIPCGN